MIPGPWEFALAALAVLRLWKLAAEDVIADRPRAWLLARLHGRWQTMIECPWCLGFWLSLAWYGLWLAWPSGALVAATPFALSAAVGIVAHFLD